MLGKITCSTANTSRRRKAFWVLVVFLLPLMVYANSMGNDFLQGGSDDEEIILRNQYLKDTKFLPKFFTQNYKAGAGSVSNFWRPFQLLVYSLIAQSFGLKAAFFHAASVIFHSLCGVLLFLFLLQLFPGQSIELPAAAVIVWLLHPMYNSELAVVSGLASPAYFFWMLAGLLSFRGFLIRPGAVRYSLSLLFFVLALFSKESAVIFPLLAAGLHFMLVRTGMIGKSGFKKSVLKHLPFWAVAGSYVWARLTLLNFSNTLNFYNQPNILTEHPAYRIYTLAVVLARGLGMFFLPMGVHPERSSSIFTGFLYPQVIVSCLVISCLAAFSVLRFKKNPFLGFGMAWFLVAFLPMSNIVAQINGVFRDHWFYVSFAGILIVLLSFASGRKSKKFLFYGFIILAAWFGLSDVRSNKYYKDTETFSRRVLFFEPGCARAWNNLAIALADKGERAEAVDCYKKAIALEDCYPQIHHNLANVYREMGNIGMAESEYKIALRMDAEFYHSYIGLGNLCLLRNDINGARMYFKKALELYPYLPEVRKFLSLSAEG